MNYSPKRKKERTDYIRYIEAYNETVKDFTSYVTEGSE